MALPRPSLACHHLKPFHGSLWKYEARSQGSISCGWLEGLMPLGPLSPGMLCWVAEEMSHATAKYCGSAKELPRITVIGTEVH